MKNKKCGECGKNIGPKTLQYQDTIQHLYGKMLCHRCRRQKEKNIREFDETMNEALFGEAHPSNGSSWEDFDIDDIPGCRG